MATVSSSTFLGGMQNIKANRAVEIKDLVNCAVVPYSNPISMTGSKNIKDTNKTKNLAIATVKLGQSAYLHSQQIQVTIELSHPKSIQRDPGCWIQLLRRECYFAGEHSKEYEHVIATTAEALHIGSDNTGAIHTTLNIPADAYPSMTTTKIVSIQYRLLILFDMRPKMGFLEMKNRRTVNRKLRTRLLEAPGGFEVDVPIVIGTISDKEHQHRPSLVMFDARDALGVHDPMTSVADATSQLSLCTAAHGATRSTPSSPGPSTAPYGQGSPTPSFYVPATHYSPKNGSSGYNTMPASYGRKLSEASHRTTSSTEPAESSVAASRSQKAPAQTPGSNVPRSHLSKPLPALPVSPTITVSPFSVSTGAPLGPSASAPHYFMPMTTASPPSALFAPPLHLPGATRSGSMDTSPTGYPREKIPFTTPSPVQIHPPPMAIQVPSPTAPHAVNLGLGPASPDVMHRRLPSSTTPGHHQVYSPSPIPSFHGVMAPDSQGLTSQYPAPPHQRAASEQNMYYPLPSSAGVTQYCSSPSDTDSAPPYTPSGKY